MKRILVFGAEGYLGKYLVKKLEKDPENAVHTVLSNRGITRKPDTSYRADLRRLDYCDYLFTNSDFANFDEIYQLAADSGSIDYLLSDKYFYGDSTLININILKSLKNRKFKGKILFPSSFYAFDINNRYGLEKRYNEVLYLASNLDVRIPRLFSVYGPGEELRSSREKVTTAFCRRILEKKYKDSMVITGYPEQVRYFLHVDDAIRGLIAFMRQSTIARCDLAGNDAISLEQLINTVIKISGKDIRIFWSGITPLEKEIYPDTNFARNNLEWEPKIKFEYGIERLYKWVENELH